MDNVEESRTYNPAPANEQDSRFASTNPWAFGNDLTETPSVTVTFATGGNLKEVHLNTQNVASVTFKYTQTDSNELVTIQDENGAPKVSIIMISILL